LKSELIIIDSAQWFGDWNPRRVLNETAIDITQVSNDSDWNSCQVLNEAAIDTTQVSNDFLWILINSVWRSSLKTGKRPRPDRTKTDQDRKFSRPIKTVTAVRSSVHHHSRKLKTRQRPVLAVSTGFFSFKFGPGYFYFIVLLYIDFQLIFNMHDMWLENAVINNNQQPRLRSETRPSSSPLSSCPSLAFPDLNHFILGQFFIVCLSTNSICISLDLTSPATSHAPPHLEMWVGSTMLVVVKPWPLPTLGQARVTITAPTPYAPNDATSSPTSALVEQPSWWPPTLTPPTNATSTNLCLQRGQPQLPLMRREDTMMMTRAKVRAVLIISFLLSLTSATDLLEDNCTLPDMLFRASQAPQSPPPPPYSPPKYCSKVYIIYFVLFSCM